MRRNSWTGLCRKSKAHSVFEGTEEAKGYLDALFVIPVDVGINDLDELVDSDVCGGQVISDTSIGG